MTISDSCLPTSWVGRSIWPIFVIRRRCFGNYDNRVQRAGLFAAGKGRRLRGGVRNGGAFRRLGLNRFGDDHHFPRQFVWFGFGAALERLFCSYHKPVFV